MSWRSLPCSNKMNVNQTKKIIMAFICKLGWTSSYEYAITGLVISQGVTRNNWLRKNKCEVSFL